MVQLRVVKTGQQVGSTWTTGREADPNFTRELRVTGRHKGSHFLVPNLDELDPAIPLDRPDHAVDAVARVAVNPRNPPSLQPLDHEVAHRRHRALPNPAMPVCPTSPEPQSCGVEEESSASSAHGRSMKLVGIPGVAAARKGA